jgi:hypothetical protein
MLDLLGLSEPLGDLRLPFPRNRVLQPSLNELPGLLVAVMWQLACRTVFSFLPISVSEYLVRAGALKKH